MKDIDLTVELAPASRSYLQQVRPFLIWLMLFYSVWLTLIVWGGHWGTLAEHWPIALAMSFGSYIAGSTPMGGGTVGFPVLVLLFDLPGSLGRNFGLAVQSVGMVSASIYIFSLRRPLEWRVLKPCLLGSLFGTPMGAAFVAPFIPDLWIKLVFAVVWASFGVMHLIKLRELIAHSGSSHSWRQWDRPIGLTVGVIGGIVASVTGVGIDMLLYATLVLLYQTDLRISIPTSVVIMAFTSVIGIVSNLLLGGWNPQLYGVEPAVFYNWLAAAPVVAVGAPLGAIIVNLISRTPTLIVVSLLCIGQFFWTMSSEQVTGWPLVASIAGVIGMNIFFHVMYSWGRGEKVFKRRGSAAPLN